jgi:hypothetical protein
MYKPIPGGSTYVVGEEELATTVYLPPVGYVWNWETNELEKTEEIICRSSVPSEQFWERPLRPDNYSKKVKREKLIQKSDPDYYDPELQNYRAREWHRRKFGAWFLNNGQYIYLTGPYYFYLAHWTIDIGPPAFKIADLDKAYFWDYCVEDPFCYGMLEMTKRRVGKTYFGACMIYEYASRVKSAHSGIQSKTGADAKKVFSEKLIQPWRKLIDFFRPTFDTAQGNIPKTTLRFFQPVSKGEKALEEDEESVENELSSWIDFENSGENAYDSQKLLRYLCDEIFKTIEANIIKRHAVIKPCLEDESGNIIGKAIYTSTVEEMEGFLEDYVKLWKQSDMNLRNENGRTESGLYRFFTPAQKIMFVDRYGYPDEARALEHIAREITGMSDPRDIASYIRKHPRNWKEAFSAGGDNCIYDPIKLENRQTILNFKKEKELFKRYNLIWDESSKNEKGIPTKVRKVENANGRFCFAWDFSDEALANNVAWKNNLFIPKNTTQFVIGIDPYDHNRTKNGTFSQGAALVYMKYDPLGDDFFQENFVAYYLGRPATAPEFWEDMVKLCHYFSCQMLFEDQKPGVMHHFIERGYGAFLLRNDKGEPGISASEKTHASIAELTEAFISDNINRVMFPRLIKDWLEYDPDDTQKFDMAMAAGYALIAANRIRLRIKTISKMIRPTRSTFVRRYSIR